RHVESPPIVAPVDMERRPTTREVYELLTRGSRVPLAEVERHPHGRVFDDVRDAVAPRDADCDARLDVGNADMMGALAAVAAEADRDAAPDELPFRLVPRRANHVVNSSGRGIAKLMGDKPWNPAFVHPDDLAALGLASGDRVQLRSRHDAIAAIVE